MEVQGTVKFIGQTQEVSASFKKREVVVTTDEQYQQHILIEFTQDKCDLLNSYHVGQQVKIGINLRGREWVNPQGETRYFNSIQGWNIASLQAQAPQQPQYAPQQPQYAPPAPNYQQPQQGGFPPPPQPQQYQQQGYQQQQQGYNEPPF